MWIMISGPYLTGACSDEETAGNTLALNRAACEVLKKGHVPIVGVNLVMPMISAGGGAHEGMMMPLCLALAQRCDAVLRLEGESDGADREVECIRSRGGAVYRRIDEIPDASEQQIGS